MLSHVDGFSHVRGTLRAREVQVSLACKDLKEVAPQIASSFPFPMAWDSRRRGSASIVAARGSTSYKDLLPYVRTRAVGNLSTFLRLLSSYFHLQHYSGRV